MLIKLFILYLNVLTLNFGIQLSQGVVVKKNVTIMNRGYSSMRAADDMWHPIIKTHNRRKKPPTLTPALSLTTTSGSQQYSNLTKNNEQKFRKYHYPHSTYNAHHHHRANYTKEHLKILTSKFSQPTTSSFSSPLQSIKHINLKSHTNTKNNNNNRTKNLNNDTETLYSQMQIPANVRSQGKEYGEPSLHNANNKNYYSVSHHSADEAKHKKLINSSSASLTYRNYSPKSHHQAKGITIIPINYTNKTFITTNLHVKATSENEAGKEIDIVGNSTDTIYAENVTDFKIYDELMDNEIGNVKKLRLETDTNISLHRDEVKTHKTDDKKISSSLNLYSTDVATNAARDDEANLNAELFLSKALAHFEKFYNKFKDIILTERHNNTESASSNDNNAEDDDYDYEMYSSDDISNDDNNLQRLNSSSHQLIKDTSTLAAAAIATVLNKMENILLSLSSTGKVKGRKTQTDNDDIKNSLKNLPSLAPLLRPPLRNANITAKTIINPTQRKDQLKNVSSKGTTVSAVPSSYSSSSASSKTHTSPSYLISTPTSKSLTMVGSGRKVKKVKKKFKKFLLPLVLAYKLKFMALIPLLVGGLILLVGSTGLAGFFFALFTAVMSLKTGGNRSAIIVKKY